MSPQIKNEPRLTPDVADRIIDIFQGMLNTGINIQYDEAVSEISFIVGISAKLIKPFTSAYLIGHPLSDMVVYSCCDGGDDAGDIFVIKNNKGIVLETDFKVHSKYF